MKNGRIKIRITAKRVQSLGPGYDFRRGDVVEIPARDAIPLLESGFAKRADDKAAPVYKGEAPVDPDAVNALLNQ